MRTPNPPISESQAGLGPKNIETAIIRITSHEGIIAFFLSILPSIITIFILKEKNVHNDDC